MRDETVKQSRLSEREGFTILEATVAAAMLTVLLVTSVQVIALLSAQQRSAERRAVAIMAVQNLVEQLESMPWEQATADAADRLILPEAVRDALPDAKVSVEAVDESEPVAARRVTIELAWGATGSRPIAPVRMTTWVFPDATAVR